MRSAGSCNACFSRTRQARVRTTTLTWALLVIGTLFAAAWGQSPSSAAGPPK